MWRRCSWSGPFEAPCHKQQETLESLHIPFPMEVLERCRLEVGDWMHKLALICDNITKKSFRHERGSKGNDVFSWLQVRTTIHIPHPHVPTHPPTHLHI